jgi:hypothetical protein
VSIVSFEAGHTRMLSHALDSILGGNLMMFCFFILQNS